MDNKLIGFAGPAASGKTTSALLLRNIIEKERSGYKDGEPCGHIGCAKHITHPCEGCGRIGSREEIRAVGLSSFAAPLKDCLAQLFDFSHAQLHTLEGKETTDPRYGVSPRTVMQKFGTEFIRGTVPDLWVILMEKTILDYQRVGLPLLIHDLRFEDECKLVRDHGGVVVHIQGRAEDRGSHESEQPLEIMSEDLMLDNSGILSDLKSNLREILL